MLPVMIPILTDPFAWLAIIITLMWASYEAWGREPGETEMSDFKIYPVLHAHVVIIRQNRLGREDLGHTMFVVGPFLGNHTDDVTGEKEAAAWIAENNPEDDPRWNVVLFDEDEREAWVITPPDQFVEMLEATRTEFREMWPDTEATA